MTEETKPKKKKVIICGAGGNASEMYKAIAKFKEQHPEYEIVTESDPTDSLDAMPMFKDTIEIEPIKYHSIPRFPKTRAERRNKDRKKKRK